MIGHSQGAEIVKLFLLGQKDLRMALQIMKQPGRSCALGADDEKVRKVAQANAWPLYPNQTKRDPNVVS
jgi:hypothetical protein